eukprot:879969-Amorphochlora_amoeboformis.AAC.1
MIYTTLTHDNSIPIIPSRQVGTTRVSDNWDLQTTSVTSVRDIRVTSGPVARREGERLGLA